MCVHSASLGQSLTRLLCDMTHSYVWHDSFICVTWLIHTCNMTPSYVWHDSFSASLGQSLTRPFHARLTFSGPHAPAAAGVLYDMNHSCMTWLVHMSTTNSCVTWLIHVWHDSLKCDMTHSCVTWLIRVWNDSFYDSFMYNMTRSCVNRLTHVWHDSFMCVPWLIHMCNMTHSYVWHDSFTCVTWLVHMWKD